MLAKRKPAPSDGRRDLRLSLHPIRVPACVIFAALQTYSSNWPYLPHCRRIPTFDAYNVSAGNAAQRCRAFFQSKRRSALMKVVIIAGATLALVTVASAADLPRPQPVYQQAPVGKMPIGKSPIGKSPVGKAPIVSRG